MRISSRFFRIHCGIRDWNIRGASRLVHSPLRSLLGPAWVAVGTVTSSMPNQRIFIIARFGHRPWNPAPPSSPASASASSASSPSARPNSAPNTAIRVAVTRRPKSSIPSIQKCIDSAQGNSHGARRVVPSVVLIETHLDFHGHHFKRVGWVA
ncbi:hypothetical protein PSPO01_04204 [Paraphaeosphaeria sporulosa]